MGGKTGKRMTSRKSEPRRTHPKPAGAFGKERIDRIITEEEMNRSKATIKRERSRTA
jgi:hypothetical protein